MNTPPHPMDRRSAPPINVWWIIWTALLVSLCATTWALGQIRPGSSAPNANPFVNLIGLVPLFISIIIRWLVVPRAKQLAQVFALFVVGLALAEGSGILGAALGGPYRDELFVLGALGIAQFMPFFARSLAQPKPEGFIPNN